jgi:hypothetical protein
MSDNLVGKRVRPVSFAGSLQISHPTNSIGEGSVNIRITDDLSLDVIVDIQCSIGDFAEALFSRYTNPCTFTLPGVSVVGKKYECKTEKVFVKTKSYDKAIKARAIRKAVASFEVGGWRGRDEDADNGHKTVGQTADGYFSMVSFHRYTDILPDDPKETAE